jgi:hypothetical protein
MSTDDPHVWNYAPHLWRFVPARQFALVESAGACLKGTSGGVIAGEIYCIDVGHPLSKRIDSPRDTAIDPMARDSEMPSRNTRR